MNESFRKPSAVFSANSRVVANLFASVQRAPRYGHSRTGIISSLGGAKLRRSHVLLAVALVCSTQMSAQTTTFCVSGKVTGVSMLPDPRFPGQVPPVLIPAPFQVGNSWSQVVVTGAPQTLGSIKRYLVFGGSFTAGNASWSVPNNAGAVQTDLSGNLIDIDSLPRGSGFFTSDIRLIVNARMNGTFFGPGGSFEGTVTSTTCPLQITTTTLPDAGRGQAYSSTLAASGGTGVGYQWSLASGTLPPGFSLLSSGILGTTGTPAAPVQSYGFTVKVQDSANNVATKLLSIVVNPSCLPPTATLGLSRASARRSAVVPTASTLPTCLTIRSTNLAIESGNRYTTSNGPRIAATGGTPPYVWQLTFPAELTNAQFGFAPFGNDVVITAPGSLGRSQTLPTGVLPVRPGSYTVSAAVTDATNQDAVFLDLTMTVSCKESSNDLDKDALPDCWEVFGIDVDEDGTFDYRLQERGSQYDRKDLFLEIDSMQNSAPPSVVVEMVQKAFRGNPQAHEPVELHVDYLPIHGAHTIPPDVEFRDGLDAWFAQTKLVYFGTQQELQDRFQGNGKPLEAKAKAFHYCIIIYRHPTNKGGAGELGGNDCVLASFVLNPAGTGYNQISTTTRAVALMHELGHNLGLHHGGRGDPTNDKPNYFSIMNYARGLRDTKQVYRKDGVATRLLRQRTRAVK